MEQYIVVKGARVNNLQNISLSIPQNKLIVITGVSGSGKSSLAFDTLYAEGQRRYVESLSAYARQFLGRMAKPECDFIMGLPPAIAIEQKTIARNPRSTVGTSTEIYEYLRLLYARIGHTFSPISGVEVCRHTTDDIIKCVLSYSKGTRFCVMAPLHIPQGRSLQKQLEMEILQGYSRVFYKNEIIQIDDLLQQLNADEKTTVENDDIYLIIDRMSVDDEKSSGYFDIFAHSARKGTESILCAIVNQRSNLKFPFSLP